MVKHLVKPRSAVNAGKRKPVSPTPDGFLVNRKVKGHQQQVERRGLWGRSSHRRRKRARTLKSPMGVLRARPAKKADVHGREKKKQGLVKAVGDVEFVLSVPGKRPAVSAGHTIRLRTLGRSPYLGDSANKRKWA